MKKPNKMGRIEGEPKKPFPWMATLKGLAVFVLILASIAGTLGYQHFINGVKAQGVSEYKTNECQKYMNEDKSASWLECDAMRVENNV